VRIGSIYITRRTLQERIQTAQVVRDWLLSVEGRELVARMARSEVKSFLAAIAEEAGMPFTGPEEFLRTAYRVQGIPTTGTGLQDDGTYDASADSPFRVFDHIKLHPEPYNPDTDPPELHGLVP
jgi:hypothetical protein